MRQLVSRMIGRFTTNDEELATLERTKGVTGSTMRVPTDKQLERGRKVSIAINSIFLSAENIWKTMTLLITCKPAFNDLFAR